MEVAEGMSDEHGPSRVGQDEGHLLQAEFLPHAIPLRDLFGLLALEAAELEPGPLEQDGLAIALELIDQSLLPSDQCLRFGNMAHRLLQAVQGQVLIHIWECGRGLFRYPGGFDIVFPAGER
jgi:hypothetical protein